jgi:hypothetical protein
MNPAEDPPGVAPQSNDTGNGKRILSKPPPRAKDPPRVDDHEDKKLKLGPTFLLDQHCTSNTEGKGLIHIEAESNCWKEKYSDTEVITRAGLSMSTSLTDSFTILSLESAEHRTPTRYAPATRNQKKLRTWENAVRTEMREAGS